jgi:hypothetical protein
MPQNRQRADRTGHISSVGVGTYVLTLERDRFYRGWRYHWMICASHSPDELVSWGHASTRDLAEAAAGSEVEKLAARLTQGRSESVKAPRDLVR